MVARTAAALRVGLFPRLVRELGEIGYMDDFLRDATERDTFFFLTHKHYLAKNLRLRQRISAALYHYTHELHTLDEPYRCQVYRRDGLVLWSEQLDGNEFEIRLVATEDNRHEGDLSVRLHVNDVLVCRLSYTIVDGALFGLAGPTAFVTRNQTTRGSGHDAFHRTFRQNSPPYFCLAALVGIAMGHGIAHLAVIRSEAQIAFEPRYLAGFKNSYCHFWEGFGAVEAGPHAYALTVPPQLPPLSTVKPGHRIRARIRRRYWNEITACAQTTIRRHRLRGAT